MAKKITRQHFKIGFSVVWTFLKERRATTLLILTFGIIQAVGNGAVPYIIGKLFDKILQPDDGIYLWGQIYPTYLFLLLGLALIQVILIVIDHRKFLLQSTFAFSARFGYQSEAYARLLELPLKFHKKRKMGEITSKISNAGMGLEVISERILGDLGPEFLTILVAIAFLLKINPELALIALTFVLAYLLIAIFLVKDSANLQSKLIDGWGKSYGDVHDVVYNTEAVKQAVTENYEQKRIKGMFKKNILPYWFKIDQVWLSLRTIRGVMVIILQLIVFLWSINLVFKNQMTIGDLIAFNSYLAMLFAPFISLMNMWRSLQNGLLDISAVEKIMQTKTENYKPHNLIPLDKITGQIVFENVSYAYEKSKPILQDLNFEVKAGDTVALVGESGVGKSTLIDLISGYNFADKGKILINNVDVKKIDLNFLRSHIAIVPQEVTLFNDTIKKNIMYGNFKATTKDLISATTKAHALNFIEKFPKKWRQMVGERGVKLSVGQKQRVAIARAILRNPSILILDEPTSALDAKSEKIIQEALNELMLGRTTFIIAHRLSTVREADLILVFADGQIVERGTHQELLKLKDGKYKHLYELQIGLHQ